MYLDCDYALEDGPNAERTKDIASLIYAIKLPWLIAGDFNKSPEEVATSSWCRYLKGIVTAPDVPFTCTNTSAAGGSLIDFTMHCRELEPYLTVQPNWHYPFRPHLVAVTVIIDKEVEVDRHRIL